MNKFTKLLITCLFATIFSFGLHGTVLASEGTAVITTSAVSEGVEPKEGTGTEDKANLPKENTAVEVSEEDLTGDVDPLEGYETFEDEQGQVYYSEKEPEPVVIKEQQEEELEDKQEVSKKATNEEPKKVKKSEAKPSYSEKDLRLLASLIYAEAGNQSYNGMLAVANVVLNRVNSKVYYHVDTIKEVIYDKKWSVQFAVTVKSKKTGLSMLDKALNSYDTGKFSGPNPEAEKKAMNKAIKAAKAALEGENNIGNYLCFNAVNKSTSRIKKKYSDYKIIGNHIFYRTK